MPTKAELEAQLEELQAENKKLRVSRTPAAPVETAGPTKTSRRWRAFAATVLIAVGVLLAPVSMVAAWAKNQVSNTEQFMATVAPLADDPAVQNYIADEITNGITSAVDIKALTASVFSSLGNLGLPSEAQALLNTLQGPAASGVTNLIRQGVGNIVASDAFTDALKQTLTLSHDQFVAMLEGDPNSGLVLGDDGSVGIRTGPFIDIIKQNLEQQGFGFASMIPSINTTITVAQNDQLVLLRPAYQLSLAVGNGLPWVAVGFLLVGVIVAVSRKRALFGAMLATGLTFLVVAAAIGFARFFVIAGLSPQLLPANVTGVVYDNLTARMLANSIAFAAVAFAIALATWFLGLNSARTLRTGVHAAVTATRDWAESRGVQTGGFGRWLWQFRVWVRLLIAVIAALVLFTSWPLTVATVVWTLVLSLLALLVLELLMRPEPATAAEVAAA